MRASPSKKMIATADTLGKIKIVEFPNIYNMLTVLLYNIEDIKYCDFINNHNLMVINSSYEIHLWNMSEFKLKSKFDLKTLLDIKLDSREDSQTLDNIEQEEGGNKSKTENEDNTNFCKEDEIIKNIFLIEGKKIILQLTDSAKTLNDVKNKHFLFEISESDEFSLRDQNVLNNLPSNDNTFIYISDNTKETIFLNLNNNERNLNIISKIKNDDMN